jgi:S-formylglutathione hydrolase FrmB
MAFCELKYFSNALGKATQANVILPQNGSGPFPVLYLLHGLSDDYSGWQRRTSIERYVQDLPLIVVMPDGGRGFYCDAAEGFACETAIARDLVEYIDTIFHTKATRAGRALAGLSMGGYGAVKLALRFPDLFNSAVSHSGALGFGHYPLSGDEPFAMEFRRVVGEEPEGGPNDLYELARARRTKRPALRIDCGTEDFLLEQNRAFHAHLQEIGYPHEYAEFPGDHTWGYWDEHVQEAIAFAARHLKIKSKSNRAAPRRSNRKNS